MRVRAVAVHDIELGCLIAQSFVVEAQVGDVLAVGRNDGMMVRPAPIGERSNRIVGQIDTVDFGVERFVIGVGAPIRRDQHALAARIECRCALAVEIAVGELADRAAVGTDDEKLTEDVGQITLAVDPEHHPVDEFGRIGPFGVLRRFGQFHFQRLAFGGHRHDECDPAAVLRPRETARRFGKIADRRRSRRSRPSTRRVASNRPLPFPRYARRPPSGDQRGDVLDGALDEGRACLAVGSDQPDDAARPVRLDVETHAHVGDAAPVRRNLWIAHPLQIEDIERLQAQVSWCLRKARRKQGDQQPAPKRAPRIAAFRSIMPISFA